MTCDQVGRLLAEGTRLPEEAGAHLAGCPDCRAAAQRWAALRQELAALREEPEPPFLHPRIMAAVRQAAAPALPWWRRVPRAAWASATLAAVLVGVLATQGILQPMRIAPRMAEEGAGRAPAPAAPQVAAEQVAGPEVEPATKARERAGEAAPVASGPPRARQEPRPRRQIDERRQKPPKPPAMEPAAAAAATPGAAAEEVRAAEAEAMLAAADGGHEALRPAAAQASGAAPPWRGQETAAAAAPSGPVVVVLLGASGERVGALTLDAGAAPPPNAMWVLEVDREGRVVLEGPPAASLAKLIPAWQRALAGADLPAGRYRAVRLPR